MMYIRNNKQFLFFLFLFVVLMNVVLFAARAYYFRDFLMLDGVTPNVFYMLSRANGKCALGDSFWCAQWPFRSISRPVELLQKEQEWQWLKRAVGKLA